MRLKSAGLSTREFINKFTIDTTVKAIRVIDKIRLLQYYKIVRLKVNESR